jgi:hypothetical protein
MTREKLVGPANVIFGTILLSISMAGSIVFIEAHVDFAHLKE